TWGGCGGEAGCLLARRARGRMVRHAPVSRASPLRVLQKCARVPGCLEVAEHLRACTGARLQTSDWSARYCAENDSVLERTRRSFLAFSFLNRCSHTRAALGILRSCRQS